MSNKPAWRYPASVMGKLRPCGVDLKVLSVVLWIVRTVVKLS